MAFQLALPRQTIVAALVMAGFVMLAPPGSFALAAGQPPLPQAHYKVEALIPPSPRHDAALSSPAATKVETDGHLITLDYAKGAVLRVDSKTGVKETLAMLDPPVDNVAIGKDGTIYVSSLVVGEVVAIDPRTHAVRHLVWGGLNAPGTVSIVDTGDSSQILVADAWGPRLVDPKTGVPAPIKRAPGVLGATSIAVHDGVYVMGHLWPSGGIQIVDRQTGALRANLTNFGAPYAIAALDDGFVVADYAVGRLTKISDDAVHTRTTLAWGFDGPVGLAAAGKGVFYVSEYGAGRLTRVDSATNERTVVARNLDDPEGIALAPDGRIIVAEVGAHRVVAIAPDTGKAEILADNLAIGLEPAEGLPAPFLPTGVAVAHDGAIYVTGDVDNVLYRLTAPGEPPIEGSRPEGSPTERNRTEGSRTEGSE